MHHPSRSGQTLRPPQGDQTLGGTRKHRKSRSSTAKEFAQRNNPAFVALMQARSLQQNSDFDGSPYRLQSRRSATRAATRWQQCLRQRCASFSNRGTRLLAVLSLDQGHRLLPGSPGYRLQLDAVGDHAGMLLPKRDAASPVSLCRYERPGLSNLLFSSASFSAPALLEPAVGLEPTTC